jgi:ssDNA-binding replication factor A large subunit
MKISELKVGMSGVSIEGRIVEISEAREVNTKYGRREVADVLVEDDTGQIDLSLWGDQIKGVKVNDKVSINGAFVSEFRGKLKLNIPRSGKLEIIKEV